MSAPEITSRTNSRVKAWRSLRRRRERDRTGLFLVEGERESLRAADHLEIVETILRNDLPDPDLPRIVRVSSPVFEAVSARQQPDGIAVVARTPDTSLEQFDPPRPRSVLVADRIEKPGNLGAMIRTADALGCAVLGSDLGTDLVNPNTVRAAQGSLFAVPIAAGARSAAIEWCADAGDVVVATPDARATLWDLDLTGDVSVVVGAEDRGVHRAWLDVGTPCRIPMRGSADSLNASVSAAILLAEVARQRST